MNIIYLLGGPADLTKRVEYGDVLPELLPYTMWTPSDDGFKICKHWYRHVATILDGAAVYAYDPSVKEIE